LLTAVRQAAVEQAAVEQAAVEQAAVEQAMARIRLSAGESAGRKRRRAPPGV